MKYIETTIVKRERSGWAKEQRHSGSSPVGPSDKGENKYTLKTSTKDHTSLADQPLQTSIINYSDTKVNRNPAPLFAYSGSENPAERKSLDL